MESDKNSKFISRRKFLHAAATAVGGLALAACGGANTGGGAAGGGAATDATAAGGAAAGGGAAPAAGQAVNIKWASWGNAGEAQRFQEYTKDWNSKNPDVQGEFILIPNDGYEAKLLTQLNGGTAPDVFYAGDSTIGKLVANNTIMDLTEMLNGPESKSKPEEFAEGLWSAAKTPEGKIFGVTVDCNPMVLWYNKKLLTDVGITDMPAALYEKGEWNREVFTGMLEQLRAAGKYGYILENWFAHRWSWMTTNGGKVYENERFVAHEDPKSVEAFQYVYDQVQAKNFTFAGGLPKGQGADAMFVSQQVGFVGAGRWLLPVFKKAGGLEYDIVPWPSNTGNKLEPAGVPTAYAVINAKVKDQAAAFKFLTNFVSKEGQIFRLQGGGNAVPSVQGADQVVTEGNLPEHASFFIETRDVGYANFATETRVPALDGDIQKALEPLWLKGGDVAATLKAIGDDANKKIEANKSA